MVICASRIARRVKDLATSFSSRHFSQLTHRAGVVADVAHVTETQKCYPSSIATPSRHALTTSSTRW
jgi:hypothetical protein